MSSAGNAATCHGWVEDSDITGVGVRSTFYVASMLAVVNACIPGCDIRGPFWAMFFTSIALLVSAVVQATNKSISLYNAIIVIYLCYIHVFSSVVVLQLLRWVHGKDIDLNLTAVAIMQCFFWLWLPAGILRDTSSFGSQPECNSKVIFFGGSLIGCLIFLGVFILFFALPPVGLKCVIRSKTVQTFFGHHAWRFGLTLSACVWVFMIITVEKTISQNPVIHTGARFAASFGQIFPVVTTGIPLVSIYCDARAWRQRKVVRWGLPEAAQDTLNTDYDAFLTYVMMADEESSVGADATFSSAILTLPATEEITTSDSAMLPGDERETTADVTIGQAGEVDIGAPCEAEAPEDRYPLPGSDQLESSARLKDHVLRCREILKQMPVRP